MKKMVMVCRIINGVITMTCRNPEGEMVTKTMTVEQAKRIKVKDMQ